MWERMIPAMAHILNLEDSFQKLVLSLHHDVGFKD